MIRALQRNRYPGLLGANLEVSDDGTGPAFYSRVQPLLATRSPHRFMSCAPGPDSLILCGNEKLRGAIGAFSGLQFQWE